MPAHEVKSRKFHVSHIEPESLHWLTVLNLISSYVAVFVAVLFTLLSGVSFGNNASSVVALLICATLNVRLLVVLPDMRNISAAAYKVGVLLIIPTVIMIL